MITLTKAWGVPNANILGFSGKSTDVKPIGKYEGMSITNGSEYKEIDTGNTYSYDAEGSSWYLNNTTTSGGGSGANGITPHIGENGNWFIGSTDTGVSAEGENGGYYIPAVTQPSSDKLQISFAPSKSDMPAVNPVTVNLPVSENSGQNANLTAEQIDALNGMFKVCAYDDSKDVSGAYGAFLTAFGLDSPGEDEPDEPVVPDIPDVPGVTQYTITNALTNVSTDNPVSAVTEGGAYMATLTADDGYTLDGGTVTVRMGGVDITSTAYVDGVVTIASVTGNVVITAAAVEVSTDSGEIVMLENISFDGTSYLDTEVIPESIDYRYVFGIQLPKPETVSSAVKNFAGVSMRDSTNLAVSAYWDVYWDALTKANNYNADAPTAEIRENCMSLISAISTGQDKGDGLSSQPYNAPLYYSWSRNAQSVWLDEGLTSTPVLGHFPGATATVDFTNQAYFTDDEHPISSIWLGKVHVTGIMEGQIGTPEKTLAGVKFYCFKVYDSGQNLIADMRPAKQGNSVGMWCNVRNQFYAATGTANYEEVSA